MSNSNNLVEKFKDFLMDWYIERSKEPMEIKYYHPQVFGPGLKDYFSIRIENCNNKKIWINLINKEVSASDIINDVFTLGDRIPITFETFEKRLFFLIHLYFIYHEYAKYKSDLMSLLDFFSMENDIRAPIFDFDKILYFADYSDYSDFTNILSSEYDFSRIPPLFSGEKTPPSKIEILSKTISSALFSGKIAFSESIFGKFILDTVSIEKKGKNVDKYVFRKKGDYWEIVFDGNALPPFKNMDGFFYISSLLSGYKSNKFNWI